MDGYEKMGDLTADYILECCRIIDTMDVKTAFPAIGSTLETICETLTAYTYTGDIMRGNDPQVLRNQIVIAAVLLDHIKDKMETAENEGARK